MRNIKASVLAAETLPELDAYKREEELGMAVMSSNDAQGGPESVPREASLRTSPAHDVIAE